MARLALLLIAALAAPVGRAASAEPVEAITGGWVIPAAGPQIPRGTVLLQGGKVLAVGPELALPEGAVVHEATGKYVTPGLVAVEAARLGSTGAPGRMGDGLDPYQREVRIALASGITTAHVVESGFGGFFGYESPVPFGGTTAIVKMTPGDLEPMLLREPAAQYFSFRRSSLGVFQLRDGFRRASEHIQRVAEAERTKARPPDTPQELERYVRILKNEVPTIAVVESDEEVRVLLELRRRYSFDLVLSGAQAGWKLGPLLAAERVPVLIKARGRDFSFDFSSPAVGEDGLIPIRQACVFAQAGVPVAILPYRRGVSLDGLAGRDLTALALDAGFAVRGGLDEDAAIRAITLEPARILRIADRVGSLEKGKDADVLIWSRLPLDYRAYVETAFVNGKVYYERAKSPLFRDIPLR